MLSDGSPAHPVPKYGRQFSLEHSHGPSPYSVSARPGPGCGARGAQPTHHLPPPQASSPAYSGSSLYSPDMVASSGPIISDVTELAPSSPLASPGRTLEQR